MLSQGNLMCENCSHEFNIKPIIPHPPLFSDAFSAAVYNYSSVDMLDSSRLGFFSK